MKFSPERRLIALVTAGVILLLLCYPLAVKKTLSARNTYKELLVQSENSKDLPAKLALLRQKGKHYDSILKILNLGSNSVQNNLIKFINQNQEDISIQIMGFKKPHLLEQENHKITTYQFKLKGSYLAILNTIHDLEQKGNFGEVVHVDFEKKRNYKTKKNSLEATIFIRQME